MRTPFWNRFGHLAMPPLRVAALSVALPRVPRWRCGLLKGSHKVFFLRDLGWTAPFHEGGLGAFPLAEVPVSLSRIVFYRRLSSLPSLPE